MPCCLAFLPRLCTRRPPARLADKFLRERSDDILDVKRALGAFEASAREERHLAKPVRGGNPNKTPKKARGKAAKANGPGGSGPGGKRGGGGGGGKGGTPRKGGRK